jgi:hypothetical protein
VGGSVVAGTQANDIIAIDSCKIAAESKIADTRRTCVVENSLTL